MNRWVLVSMVLLVALSGCRNRYATVSEDLLPLAKELSPDRLFSEVLVRHDKDTSAQMKAMAYVSLGGNTARSRVQIRWARDRALQISILPLMGVEICRMVLTPDTVYLIDRYHKQYVKESVDEWLGQSSMDISFGSIQSLFLARPFCREEKPCPTMFRSLMSLPLVRDIDILILPASLLVIIILRSIIGLVSGLFCGIRLLLPVHWCVGMPVIIWSRSRSVLHK